MYYEESIIDGVLCYREDPNGNWVPFTAEELTDREKRMRSAYYRARDWWRVAWKAMDAATELAELMDFTVQGQYEPDTFTTQPIWDALNNVAKISTYIPPRSEDEIDSHKNSSTDT